MEHQAKRKKVGGRPGEFQHRIPVLLILVAAMSVVMLGLATAAIASGASRVDVPQPPMELPGPAASSSGGSGVTANWILGAPAGDRTSRIAERFEAISVGGDSTGIFRIATGRADALARRLRATVGLDFAEPDVKAEAAGYPSDLLYEQQTWLNQIVNTTDVTPPPVSAASPELGLIEEAIDANHPDLRQANLTNTMSIDRAADWHGTAIAAIAGSPAEGLGIRGVWPGMPMRQFPTGLTCSTTTAAVIKAVKAKVAVLNMSYGFAGDACYSHYLATETAVKKGIVPVAAAGNTNAGDGNVAMRPATDPHVISVSAVDSSNLVAGFATRNDKVDITAPGVNVFGPTVSDGSSSGTAAGVSYGWSGELSGTSYSTPMVAAAAAMVKQARPGLDASQVGRLLVE